MRNDNGFEKGLTVPICPSENILKKAFSAFILSPSGFRKVFAVDGIEESATPAVSSADAALTIFIAREFATLLKEHTGKAHPVIVTGTDTRPTGPALAELFIRTFLSEQVEVRMIGVAAAPEIMAYAKTDGTVDAFAYISASHNPIGHNGFKFGWGDGAVLDPDTANVFIDRIRKKAESFSEIQSAVTSATSVSREKTEAVMNTRPQYKEEALRAYDKFSAVVFTGEPYPDRRNEIMNRLRESASSKNIGIVIDFNGSARTLSIDKTFLSSCGLAVRTINSKPGQIMHRIVPEGISLEPCRRFLEDCNREESFKPNGTFFPLGFTPDNDGDRGNIVYMQGNRKTAAVPEAQQLFALCVLSELASLTADGCRQPLAVAVNCCTSDRIEAIASVFGAKVFRAEVGEANVVNLARRLRREGYLVRILGEGSNGGNITDPATVRDPLNTIGSLLKLLTRPELFRLWCERTDQNFIPDYSLETIIESLPPYSTTGSYEPQAKLDIQTTNHAALKAAYEALFPACWESELVPLRKELDLVSWREFNYEKTEEKEGVGSAFRSGQERGGFKIRFYNSAGEPVAFVWMRGSGTEPVFRILAEVKGLHPNAEAGLLRIHSALIREADRLCTK